MKSEQIELSKQSLAKIKNIRKAESRNLCN